MSRFAVVFPAAGKSSRFTGQARKKVFAELRGRPVWLRSVDAFLSREDVVQMILVVAPDDLEWFRDKFRPNLAFIDLQVIPGGAERADSVAAGLRAVRDDVDYVAVHDAARPLIAKEWIAAVFRAAEENGAALLASPVTSTLKRADEHQQITETVSRAGMWAAQTPQVVRRDWLVNAFAQRGSFQPTDEAQLLERAGHKVRVVPCSALNLKITTAEDLRIAAALWDLLPQERVPRLLHPFGDEDPRMV